MTQANSRKQLIAIQTISHNQFSVSKDNLNDAFHKLLQKQTQNNKDSIYTEIYAINKRVWQLHLTKQKPIATMR